MRYRLSSLAWRFGLSVLFCSMYLCGIYLLDMQPLQVYAQSTDPNEPLSRPISVQAQVVGGVNANKGEFPWQVLIYPGSFQCGGSLINENWVVTAAHCLYDNNGRLFDEDEISVVLGEHNVNINEGSEQQRSVRSYIVHPNYNSNTSDSDLALIELDSPALFNAFVQPITLVGATEGNLLAARQLSTIMGWGATSESGPSASILQKVSVPIVSLKTCRDAYSSSMVTSNMICAGETDKDSCQGDSGGPLVVNSPNGWRQIGVVSWGIGCARDEYYGVYTRLINYLDWVNENAQLQPTPTPQPTNTPLPTPTPTFTSSPTNTPLPNITPIPTSTPETIPTSMPTAIPTATPGVSEQNLLNNGDFELGGNGAWYESSSTFNGSSVLILELLKFQSSILPHSGDYAVWLGGADLENGNLSQTANIPATLPVTLSYFYQIRAQDDCGGDSLTISVNNDIVYDVELCQETQTSGWFQNTIDLSSYSGQFVTLGFNISTDDYSPTVGAQKAASNFFMDDVVLTTGLESLPTPTPMATATLVPTLVPTLLPTDETPGTPSPTATSTPVPAINVVENGSFENTASDAWVEDSKIYGGKGSLITSKLDLPQGILTNSGSYIAWLGGANDETSQLSQRIELPLNAETLNFYYEIRSTDACGYDRASVLINEQSQVDFALCVNEETLGWQLHTINISEYAGQTVNITFRLASDDLLVSNWFIDDVVVATASKPQIAVDPANLLFTKADDGSISPQSINVTTDANTVWSIIPSSEGWLEAKIRGGQVGVGPGAIQVSVEPSNLSQGTYEGSIALRAGAALVEVPVSLNVLVDSVGDASPDVLPLDAGPGLSSVALEWGIPRSNKVNLYQVYRRDESGQGFDLIDATEEPRTRDGSDNLVAGERYCYQVEGMNSVTGGTVVGPALSVSEVACATYGQLSLWIPTFVAKPDDTVAVPINVVNADGLQLKDSDLWIDFDTNVISVTGVSPSANALSADWVMEISEVNSVKSRVKVSLAPTIAETPVIYGSGPLFYLNASVVGVDGDRSALEFRNNVTGIGGSSITVDDGNGQSENAPLSLTDGLLTIQQFGEYAWGDVDKSGRVEEGDAMMTLNFATEQISPQSSQFNAAEVNGSREIEAADATLIFYYAVNGSWPVLPAGQTHSASESPATSPSALPEISISVSDVDSVGGELVNILVEASGLDDFAGGDLVLIYDPSVIAHIDSVSLGGQLDGFQRAYDTSIPGRLAISLAGIREIDDVNTIAQIRAEMARIPDNISSPLRLADAKLNDLNGRDLIDSFANRSLSLQNATITLEPGQMEMFLPFLIQ